MIRLFLAAFLLLTPLPAWAEATITVVTYNTESDADTDPALVAEDIARMAEGVDLWLHRLERVGVRQVLRGVHAAWGKRHLDRVHLVAKRRHDPDRAVVALGLQVA